MAVFRQGVNAKWLTLTKEEPINPALAICDPHTHIWAKPDPRYETAKQTGREMRPIDYYSPEDLLKDNTGGHNIEKTVFVECIAHYKVDGHKEMYSLGETEFVAKQSGKLGKTEIAAGMVGFVDLMLGKSVKPVIEAHIAAAGKKFRGIRESCSWPVNPDLNLNGIKGIINIPHRLADEQFREGVTCLKRYNLSLDLALGHKQLPDVADLAKAFPDVRIIVNHTGGPGGIHPHDEKREEAIAEWQQGIAGLAAYPNVYMKLGGLGSRTDKWYERPVPPGSEELAGVMAPYILFCIEKLGANRCMFESNYPEDKVYYSYIIIWNAFKRIAKDFSASEQRALFHDTAVKAYGLK